MRGFEQIVSSTRFSSVLSSSREESAFGISFVVVLTIAFIGQFPRFGIVCKQGRDVSLCLPPRLVRPAFLVPNPTEIQPDLEVFVPYRGPT